MINACRAYSERGGKFVLEASRTSVAFRDGFPLSRGHTLVVPHRHVASVFELEAEEQADPWRLVATVRLHLLGRYALAGFNVCLNDSAAAGQTVAHAHAHLIPRYEGYATDPHDGVRLALPT